MPSYDLFVDKLETEGREVQVDLINIPDDAIPGRAQKAVERLGVLSSILLREVKGGRYNIIEGRGRVLDYVAQGLSSVWALVVPITSQATDSTIAAAGLSSNMLRRPNPAHEAMALGDMVYTALAPFGVKPKTKPQDIPADRLADVFRTLSRELSFDPNVLRARWRLLLIPPSIMRGVLDGVVAPTVAVELSKKPAFVQEVAEAELSKAGKLTGNMVHQLQMAHTKKVTQEAATPDLFDASGDPGAYQQVSTKDQLLHDLRAMIREGWTVTALRELVKMAYNQEQEETT